MAPKAVVIQLRPGIAQASLPDHRKAVNGVQYTLDWHTFKQISAGALENVIDVVSVINTGGALWMTDNGNAIIDPQTILTTVGANPPKNQIGGQAFQGFDGTEWGNITNTSGVITNAGGFLNVGSVALGTQDERWMLVQNIAEFEGSPSDIDAGDVCVWCNSAANAGATVPSIGEQNRQVTNQRPAYATNDYAIQVFPTDNFAGVAVAAIPAGEYGWIQIEGECDVINTGTNVIAVGAPISVDESNPGWATTSAGLSTLGGGGNVSELSIYDADSGTFTLTWNSLTTGAITFSATAATTASNAQTALRLLSGASAATVTGSGPADAEVLVITIAGGHAVTADITDLVGAAVSVSGATTSWTVAESADATGGTFNLAGTVSAFHFTGGGGETLTIQSGAGLTAGTFQLASAAGTANTSSLNWDASGTTIAAALTTASGLTYTAVNGAVLLNSGQVLSFTMSGDDTVTLHSQSGLTWQTATIAWDAAASVIEAAINTAGGAGLCSGATGGPLPTSVPITVTSQTISVADSNLTPQPTDDIVTSQTITLANTVEGGTFGLVYGNYQTEDIPWNADAIVVLTALKKVPGFPVDTTAIGGPLPSTVTIQYPAGQTTYVTAIIDDELTYDASGQVFGTALTASDGDPEVSVEGYIRVNRPKKPYMRQLSQYGR